MKLANSIIFVLLVSSQTTAKPAADWTFTEFQSAPEGRAWTVLWSDNTSP